MHKEAPCLDYSETLIIDISKNWYMCFLCEGSNHMISEEVDLRRIVGKYICDYCTGTLYKNNHERMIMKIEEKILLEL